MFERSIKVAAEANPAAGGAGEREASWLDVVQQQIASLRFGVVQITVHDSRVVQIERTERVRLDRNAAGTH